MVKAWAVRMMVRLLARWGYLVTFQEPLILQAELGIDRRALALSRPEVEKMQNYAIRRVRQMIADEVLKSGHIGWRTYDSPERMERRVRGRFEFYPVVPR